jgi:hypothetical protein
MAGCNGKGSGVSEYLGDLILNDLEVRNDNRPVTSAKGALRFMMIRAISYGRNVQ